MASFDLVACDLALGSSITYTYERDDGSVCSWIDHILCSVSHGHMITQVCPVNSDVILSDHLPISFSLAVSPVCVASSSSNVVSDYSLSSSPMCNWSKLSNAILMSIGILILFTLFAS